MVVPVARLLRTVELMPQGSGVQRRDRLLCFCVVILAARPVDVTSLARGSDSVLRISPGGALLRLVADKGSQLSHAAASSVISIPHHSRMSFGDALSAYLGDISGIPRYPLQRLRGLSPLFPCLTGVERGKPLRVQTVSHILRRFLVAARAPAAMRPKDIRSSVSSSAYELGCRVEDVCRHCRWHSVQTFMDYYYRTDLEQPLRLSMGSRDGAGVPMACFEALVREFPGPGIP